MKSKKKIKKFLRKHWQLCLVIVVAVLFFLGTSSFNFYTQSDDFVKWASPDENSNYIFTKLYGQTGELTISEKYNLYAGDIIHPRSFRSDFGVLKPVSFLGIILIYGKIVSFTTYKILPFLTPFFASLGIVFFYLLIKQIFGRRNAFICAFLLAIFPPYIYYTARSMFHNILFLVLLIIGLYFLVAINKKEKTKYSNYVNLLRTSLAGIFFGLSIMVRTSELMWVAPMLAVIWFFYIKRVSITKLILFLSLFFLAATPALYYNKILYGSYFFGGYSEMNQSIVNIANAGSDIIKSTASGSFAFVGDLIGNIKDNIFYFGFRPYNSAKMFYYYFVKMFWWIFVAAALGFFIFLSKWKKQKYRYWAYLVGLALTSFILIIYYGSWEFHDNPDPKSFTIGNSYTRYWLPIYLGAFPFVAMFVIRFTRFLCRPLVFLKIINKKTERFISPIMRKRFFLMASRAIILIFISFVSIQFVLFGSEEGLIYLTGRQKAAEYELNKIVELTESDSVIITRYHDKLLFPERKVIVGLFDDSGMIEKYAKLANLLPLYYYNFTFPQKDLDYLNNKRLKEFDLNIEEVQKITSDFSLYRLIEPAEGV